MSLSPEEKDEVRKIFREEARTRRLAKRNSRFAERRVEGRERLIKQRADLSSTTQKEDYHA